MIVYKKYMQSQKPEIDFVLVDENSTEIRPFFMALRVSGFTARVFNTPEDCLNWVDDGGFALVYVLDVMMPTRGDLFSAEDTYDYLMTGVVLARELRARRVESEIVFFTGMNNDYHLNEIRRACDELSCSLLHKSEFDTPYEFRNSITKLHPEAKSPPTKYFRKIYKKLILQPNFHGIGINLKK